MIARSYAGRPAPRGLRDGLRTKLQVWSNEIRQSFGINSDNSDLAQAPCNRSIRVLVADDSPVNLIVISSLLEARGLVPLLAADGGEAVALACGLKFDLILMDLQMPTLDGLEATSAIRQWEAQSLASAVPVLAYSSSNLGPGLLAAHGFNGRLAKPCDGRALDACLIQWCPSYQCQAASS